MSALPRNLARAAVLGSGVMGAQIAACLANAGVAVDLLDVALPDGDDPAARARAALARLATLHPAPLYLPAAQARIRPGTFERDMARVREVDWVVEAIVEDLDTKVRLWRTVAGQASPRALLTTNTSGLSIAAIAGALPEAAQARFAGSHFFNPPRYMRLVEIVPAPQTAPESLRQLTLWLERDLGKSTVVVRDRPNFVANRIGGYALAATLAAMAEHGLGPEEVDALTGPAIGHPTSATFRTLDLVGLDTALAVADHLAEGLDDPAERALVALPPYVRAMVERGLLGHKSGGGFYRRRADAGDGRRRYDVIDLATLTYRAQEAVRLPALERARRESDLAARLRLLTAADEPAGRFTWTVLKRILLYAARIADEVAGGDLATIDRAMRYGYNWSLGPFETWAALGLAEASARMRAEGETLPALVAEALARGQSRLYDPPEDAADRVGNAGNPGNAAAPLDAPALLRRPPIWRGDSATLVDVGEDVACLVLHPLKDAIGPDLMAALHRAARDTEADHRGLILSAARDERFLVGANLMLLLAAAQSGDEAAIAESVERLQAVHMELKYLTRPVVAAPAGMVLGGGAELCLHADRVVAGAELYIGQVEAGAGLIPAGGGTKEFLLRTLAAMPPGAAWNPALAAAAAPASVGSASFLDPAPFIARAFETLALAKVSTSADEARELGFLRPTDEIVVHPERRLGRARAVVCALDGAGYRPPLPPVVPAPGREVRSLFQVAIDALVRSRRASAHDARIAGDLAHVLCGGDVAMGTALTEEWLLELEREAFVRLVMEPRTQARMEHLLATGRPLRN